MTTVAVKGLEELTREMSRLNVAVARRLSANAATSGAKVVAARRSSCRFRRS
jgi:hypothetical protein